MRGSRGGDRGSGTPPPPPPPPEICQRWGLVWIFDGYERESKGCFYLIFIIFFWLAPLASIQNIVNILKNRNYFQVQRVSLLPSYTLSLAFMKVLFPCLFCLKLHDFIPISTKKILGEDPQNPPPLWHHLHILRSWKQSPVFYMKREKTRDIIFIKSIVYKAVSNGKIDFDHTKAIDTEAPYPLFPFFVVGFFFFFFFACQNFYGRLDPPWRKFLDPRLVCKRPLHYGLELISDYLF